MTSDFASGLALQEAAAAAAALNAARAGASTVPELQQMLDEVRAASWSSGLVALP